ncbi:hypothetical protein HERIO_118 [Hepatospora eriocheir]|uniref:Uncharacterized protein n=1 Tax=Hepatospora eriocheir TaxID=1081669 RepID=A0A1X0QDY6_9MICR|nr:hypothetical protein HERIO_118 [Hepatospora eriocheir]
MNKEYIQLNNNFSNSNNKEKIHSQYNSELVNKRFQHRYQPRPLYNGNQSFHQCPHENAQDSQNLNLSNTDSRKDHSDENKKGSFYCRHFWRNFILLITIVVLLSYIYFSYKYITFNLMVDNFISFCETNKLFTVVLSSIFLINLAIMSYCIYHCLVDKKTDIKDDCSDDNFI